MKKIIVIFLILLLGGCSAIERILLRETKKPEENILPNLVEGVTFTELNFTKVLATTADPAKARIDALFADGNLLYFSLSSYSDSAHPDAAFSTGIYTYNLTTKAFIRIFIIDPSKKYYVSSIAVLRGRVYFSGGYPITDKAGEHKYEISVINGTKATVLLKDTTYDLNIPKLLKFSDISLVFLQVHYEAISQTEFKSTHKITQIKLDSSLRSSTEYGGVTDATTSEASLPFASAFTLNGMNIAYAANKNKETLLYSATYDSVTQKFKDMQLIKVGNNLSPEALVGFGNHWYITAIKNGNSDHLMHVYEMETGRKSATQIFANHSKAYGLASFENKNGLFIGDFMKGDGSQPNGIGRLYLAHFDINTVKYQRIDKFINTGWPISSVKLSDKQFLIQGKLELGKDLKYYIIEFK
ncbi:MAG: hypothetical protein WBL80_05625 [Erysipelotrichaceae bacterium]